MLGIDTKILAYNAKIIHNLKKALLEICRKDVYNIV